jgi:hypothetical protein
MRGAMGRRKAAAKRKEKVLGEIESMYLKKQKAASSIQRIVRGRQTRNFMKNKLTTQLLGNITNKDLKTDLVLQYSNQRNIMVIDIFISLHYLGSNLIYTHICASFEMQRGITWKRIYMNFWCQ